MSDRTVHAIAANGAEIVRYDRAGKWYAEYADGTRRLITLDFAAEIATMRGAKRFPNLSGGQRFDVACTRRPAAAVSGTREEASDADRT